MWDTAPRYRDGHADHRDKIAAMDAATRERYGSYAVHLGDLMDPRTKLEHELQRIARDVVADRHLPVFDGPPETWTSRVRRVREEKRIMPERIVDVTVQNEGSILLLRPLTDDAKQWFDVNIGPDNGYQPWWPTVVVEPRYIADILDGLSADGLIWAGGIDG